LPQSNFSKNLVSTNSYSFSVKDGVLASLGAIILAIIAYRVINWSLKCYYDREAKKHIERLHSTLNSSQISEFGQELSTIQSKLNTRDSAASFTDTRLQFKENNDVPQPEPFEDASITHVRTLHFMQNGAFLCNEVTSPISPWFFARISVHRGPGIQVKCIKDSGCDKSVMSGALFAVIPQSHLLQHFICQTKEIETACGHKSKVEFSVEVWITFLDKDGVHTYSKQCMIMVVNNLEADILIGQDIINGPDKILEDRFSMYFSSDRHIKRTIQVTPADNLVVVPLRTNERFEEGKRLITVNNVNYISDTQFRGDITRRTTEDGDSDGEEQLAFPEQAPQPAKRQQEHQDDRIPQNHPCKQPSAPPAYKFDHQQHPSSGSERQRPPLPWTPLTRH
jgi:hypothetical protein